MGIKNVTAAFRKDNWLSGHTVRCDKDKWRGRQFFQTISTLIHFVSNFADYILIFQLGLSISNSGVIVQAHLSNSTWVIVMYYKGSLYAK